MSTVTGRTYIMTRPRGSAPWRPRRDTAGLLDTIRGVLAGYGDQLPPTARQVFNPLVGAHGYAETKAAYDRLCETLCRARRVGLITIPLPANDRGLPSRKHGTRKLAALGGTAAAWRCWMWRRVRCCGDGRPGGYLLTSRCPFTTSRLSVPVSSARAISSSDAPQRR